MGEVTRGKDLRRRRILDLKKSVRPSVVLTHVESRTRRRSRT